MWVLKCVECLIARQDLFLLVALLSSLEREGWKKKGISWCQKMFSLRHRNEIKHTPCICATSSLYVPEMVCMVSLPPLTVVTTQELRVSEQNTNTLPCLTLSGVSLLPTCLYIHHSYFCSAVILRPDLFVVYSLIHSFSCVWTVRQQKKKKKNGSQLLWVESGSYRQMHQITNF